MVRPILAAFVLAQILSFAHAASAQTKQWDQAAVTDAAVKLEAAISDLRNIVNASPNLQNPAVRRPMYEIVDDLRQMEFTAQSLKASLVKGNGMEETLPTYNRLQQQRRYTEIKAKRVDISAITRPKLEAAQEQLAILEPYYPAQPKVEDLK